jgi:hypothetical protein
MRLRSSRDSAIEGVLDELEANDLGLVEIVVDRVTVVKFRMGYGSGDGRGSFEVDESADERSRMNRNSLKRGKRSAGRKSGGCRLRAVE